MLRNKLFKYLTFAIWLLLTEMGTERSGSRSKNNGKHNLLNVNNTSTSSLVYLNFVRFF